MDETGRDNSFSSEAARAEAGALKGKLTASATAGGGGSPPPPPNLERRITSLSRALSRARIESAEHASVISELRGAEIARLEMLREQLDPVVAQLPQDCDLFDIAVSPGERPRLFIDQIGFVEMGRDRRNYQFVQDTRHGRITICESEKLEVIVEAVTAYIAHRLIEREKALAVDFASSGAGAAGAARAAARLESSAGGATKRKDFNLRAMQVFLFLVELLGSVTFFGLLGLLAVWVYRNFTAH